MLISAIDLGTRKLWSAKVCYLVNYILQVGDLKGGKRMGPIVQFGRAHANAVMSRNMYTFTRARVSVFPLS